MADAVDRSDRHFRRACRGVDARDRTGRRRFDIARCDEAGTDHMSLLPAAGRSPAVQTSDVAAMDRVPRPMGGRRPGGRRCPRLRCGPGTRSRRGAASSDRSRAERARGARRQTRLAAAGRTVHQRDDPGPARCGRDHRGHRRPQGHRHHPGHRRAQRDHRVRPGIPGGASDGRAETHDQPVGAHRSCRRHDRRPGGRAWCRATSCGSTPGTS